MSSATLPEAMLGGLDPSQPAVTRGLERPSHLRTEYHVDPLGLDETRPRFSWQVNDDRRGARQSSYRILVAATTPRLAADDGELWDSDRVGSDATAHVPYAGAALGAFSRAVWKVRTWDAEGRPSPWSEPASFELGPLTNRDWDPARFIRSRVVGDLATSAPSPYLRRSFTCEGSVVRARLYVTALGLYEASINGRPVSDDVYRPGWTDYSRRVPYQAYDVTDLLRPGVNVLGALLGDGWYCGFIGTRRQHWGDRPHLLAKLVVDLAGEPAPLVVGTDETCRTTTGPILAGDNYNGETYDARLELSGWDQPGYDDGSWEPVEVVPSSFGTRIQMVATTGPPVRRIAEFAPGAVTSRAPGIFLFDLGQNMVGRARLRVTAPAGTELTLRFAEMLNDDGTLHTANLGSARATDRYVCRGGDEEVYEPRFTFHGFRYVEVSGSPSELGPGAITGIVLHSDAPVSGDFACSNELVNQLQRNIQWSQRGNFLDVPTDCPQRAERLGWTGDIQVFARTATFNMDVASFLAKYTVDLRDAQMVGGIDQGTYPTVAPSVNAQAGGPGWADAGVIVPWTLYERYGDERALERHYPSLLGYMDFLERAARGDTEGTWKGFGDWLSLDVDADPVEPGDDRFGGTPRDYLWQAFDIHVTGLVSTIAAILDRPADARCLADRRDATREQFVQRYVGADGHLTVRTQTAYLLALHFDLLVDRDQRQTAISDLIANLERVGHLQTGFLGTPYLLPGLSDIGRTDLAYRLLERTEYPGWLYPVMQGATTMWERWDAWTAEGTFKAHTMNSFNHYAYGAVGEWLYRVVAGIDTTAAGAGYRRLLIRPEPGGTLTFARAYHTTIRGRVATAWQLDGDRLALSVSIPPNTAATLRLPATSADLVTEAGIGLAGVDGISGVRNRDGRVECQAEAGSYEFLIARPIVARAPDSSGPER